MRLKAGSAAFLLVIAGFLGFWGSLWAAELININTATLAELDTLPGIGPTLAQRIIDGRPYTSATQISTVQGIGEPGSKTYDDIIDLITVGSGAQTQTQTQTTQEENEEENEEEDTETDEQSDSTDSSVTRPKPPSSITAHLYAEKYAVAGAEIWFEAEAKEGSKKLGHAKFDWSFGDGASARGGRAVHTYAYPGKYAVTVIASAGGVENTVRHTIEILPLQLALVSENDGSLSVVSSSKQDTDIGYWSVAGGETTFTFPEGTVVLAGETLRLSPAVSGISYGAGAVLFYSTGSVAATAQPRSAVLAAAAPQPTAVTRSVSSADETQVLGVSESQMAAVAAGEPVALPASWSYFLALAALLVIGAGSVFYLQQTPTVAAGSPADEFEIIDAKR